MPNLAITVTNLEAELGKIFADIKSGKLPPGSIIGTESHARLGRLSANEALYQYLDILRIGVQLDIKGRGLRTWDTIGGLTGVLVLMEDFIDMVIAHKHSADLSKTERDTNDIKRKAIREGWRSGTMKKGGPGWFVGNRCPAWLTPVSEPVVYDGREFMYRIDDEWAEIVRMIVHWADEGIGTRIIARRLTDQGIEPFGNAHRKNPAKKLVGWHGRRGAPQHRRHRPVAAQDPDPRRRHRCQRQEDQAVLRTQGHRGGADPLLSIDHQPRAV
jgi:hypothetical protein